MDQLKRDTGLTSAEELRSCMLDRDVWKAMIRGLARDVDMAGPTKIDRFDKTRNSAYALVFALYLLS